MRKYEVLDDVTSPVRKWHKILVTQKNSHQIYRNWFVNVRKI